MLSSLRCHEMLITTLLLLLYITWIQLKSYHFIRYICFSSCSIFFLGSMCWSVGVFSDSVLNLYQNSADELYLLFEQFCDHFHATSRNLMYMNFISSHSNNIHAREQLRSIKDKASNPSQVVRFCWLYPLLLPSG